MVIKSTTIDGTTNENFSVVFFFNEIIVGTQSLDTSRTNIRPIYVKSSQLNVSAISRTLACTAAYFSFSPLVTRKESIN